MYVNALLKITQGGINNSPNGTNFRRFGPLISSESSSLLKMSFTSRRFFFAFAFSVKLMPGVTAGGVSMLAGLFNDLMERIEDRESSSFCIPLLFELKCVSLDADRRLLCAHH